MQYLIRLIFPLSFTDEASGVTTDWTQDVAGIDINYTIELRDTGEYGFLLPPDQILPTGEELFAALQVLAQHVMSKSTG